MPQSLVNRALSGRRPRGSLYPGRRCALPWADLLRPVGPYVADTPRRVLTHTPEICDVCGIRFRWPTRVCACHALSGRRPRGLFTQGGAALCPGLTCCGPLGQMWLTCCGPLWVRWATLRGPSRRIRRRFATYAEYDGRCLRLILQLNHQVPGSAASPWVRSSATSPTSAAYTAESSRPEGAAHVSPGQSKRRSRAAPP